MGQTVEFEQTKDTIQGVFKGIDRDGAIQIENEHGLQSYYQGRLRLKSAK